MGWVQLPLWALVTFGAYSLGSIGYSLFTFRDCPDAHAELLQVRFRCYVHEQVWKRL